MAAVTSYWATPITTRNTTSSLTYVSIQSIASTEFVAGEKYLIFGWFTADNSTASLVSYSTLFHGSTAFANIEHSLEHPNTGTSKAGIYFNWTVWTAVASEAISLQVKVDAGTLGYRNVCLGMIRLTGQGLTQGTDWDFAEVATDTSLSTTPLTDGASLTVTPPANSNLLVMAAAQLDEISITTEYGTRIFSSGTYSSTLPSVQREGEDSSNNEQLFHTTMRVFTNLGATSQTFREESFNAVGGASGTRLHSQIFWLRLNAFKEHTVAYTEANLDLSATNWNTQFQADVSITPSVTGNIFVFAHTDFTSDLLSEEIECRLRQDNTTDVPFDDSTTILQYQEGADNTDVHPVSRLARVAVTASTSYSFDWEGALNGTAGAGLDYVRARTLCMFTTELAPVVSFDAAYMAAMNRPWPDLIIGPAGVASSGMTPPDFIPA